MANKRISELSSRTPSATDLMLVGDPTTGYSYKCLVSQVGGVTSVFGRTGAVTAQEGDYSLTSLSDVTITSPASGDILTYNGSSWVNSAGGFVPYTGATANVSLGEYGILAGWYRLDLTPTGTPTDQGTMYWDDNQKTLALIMNGTTQKVGHDQFYYAKNSTGTTIPKGTAVRFAGTDGGSGHLLITPFLADGSNPSSYFMGVTAEAITNGSFGKVQSFGRLDGVDTSAFAEGDILYASTTVAGGFQTTVPVAPNNIVQVAAVVSDAVNGKLLIRPTLGSKLTSDESVKLTSLVNGNVLQYNSTLSVWENVAPSSLAVSNIYTANGTLTGNRTVTMGANSLTFTGTGYSILYAETTGTSGAGYFVTKYGTALGYLGTYSDSSVRFSVASTNYTMLIHESGNGLIVGTKQASPLIFGTSDLQRMRIFAGGNIGINTTTDAGFRLDVNGTFRAQSFTTINAAPAVNGDASLVINGTTNNSTGGQLYNIRSIATVATNTGNMNGIDSAINNSTTAVNMTAFNAAVNISANTTTTAKGYNAGGAVTGTGIVTSYIGYDFLDAFKSGSGAITRQFGIRIANLTAGGTANVGILFNNAASTGVSGTWDIYSQSGNNSYFAGNIGIGTTSPTYKLHVVGTSRITGNTEFSTASGAYMIIGAAGDTTYRLSVDGDLRVYGNIRTAQPTGGTGVGVWRLGSTATGTFTLDTTTCVEIEIGGSLIKLATVS